MAKKKELPLITFLKPFTGPKKATAVDWRSLPPGQFTSEADFQPLVKQAKHGPHTQLAGKEYRQHWVSRPGRGGSYDLNKSREIIKFDPFE